MHIKKMAQVLVSGCLAAVMTLSIAAASCATGIYQTTDASMLPRDEAAPSISLEDLPPVEGGWYQISYKDLLGDLCSGWLEAGPAGDAVTGQEPVSGTVTVGPLNISAGPGSTYDKVGTLTAGDPVTVLAASGGWYYIASGDTLGYLSVKCVTLASEEEDTVPPLLPDLPQPDPVDPEPDPTPDPEPDPTPAPDPEPDPTPEPSDTVTEEPTDQSGVVNTATLNVRSGPGSSYSRVGSLKKGAQVHVTAIAGSWYKITCGTVSGYVSAAYVTLGSADTDTNSDSGSETDQQPEITEEPTDQSGVVNTATLNVRSGPGSSYSRVGSLKKGAQVHITAIAGSWYKITCGTVSGYVSAAYVTLGSTDTDNNTDSGSETDQQPEITEEPTDQSGVVSTATLNVRSGPGSSYSRVGSLKKGAQVHITAIAGSWYKITCGTVSGYVSAAYITLGSADSDSGTDTDTAPDTGADTTPGTSTDTTPDTGTDTTPDTGTDTTPGTDTETTPSYTEEPADLDGLVTASSLNVRSGPGTSYGKIGSLSIGAQVEITATSGSWYKVTKGSLTGWVSAQYVAVLSDLESTSSVGSAAAAMAISLLGCKYVYGAEGPTKFDCSGLAYYIFGQLGCKISRTASAQYRNDGTFVSIDNIQPGDMVFFFDPRFDSSGGTAPTTHMGIYVGDGRFIHASTTSYTVQYDDLFNSYYTQYIVGVKRVG